MKQSQKENIFIDGSDKNLPQSFNFIKTMSQKEGSLIVKKTQAKFVWLVEVKNQSLSSSDELSEISASESVVNSPWSDSSSENSSISGSSALSWTVIVKSVFTSTSIYESDRT